MRSEKAQLQSTQIRAESLWVPDQVRDDKQVGSPDTNVLIVEQSLGATEASARCVALI